MRWPAWKLSRGAAVGAVLMLVSGVADGQQIFDTIPGNEAGSQFGQLVANVGDIDGDGVSDMAVGSPKAGPTSSWTGAVTVFSGADHKIVHHAIGGFQQGQLGFAVGAVGDVDMDGVTDFAGGAPFASANGVFESGEAFVYSGATGEVIWQPHGELGQQSFGMSMTTLGDLDGDGHDEFVIGAPGTGNLARVFSGKDGSIIKSVTSFAPSTLFGHAIAGTGDVNGDGVRDLLVSAPLEAVSLSKTGRAYVYSGVDFSQIHAVESAGFPGSLGQSVTYLPDITGDQRDDFAVGGGFTSSGLHVYSGQTGASLYSIASGGVDFGYSVIAAGDINGDGKADIVAGAPTSQPFGATVLQTGLVRGVSGPTGQTLFELAGKTENEYFGHAVAAMDDLTGDGLVDLLVGVPLGDDLGVNAGRVHLMSSVAIPVVPVPIVLGDKIVGATSVEFDTHLVRFEALQSTSVKLKVSTSGTGILPRIRLEDDQGAVFNEWTFPAFGNKITVTTFIPKTGTWSLRIDGVDGTVGSYVLKTSRKLPSLADDKKKTLKKSTEHTILFDAMSASTATIKLKPVGGAKPFQAEIIDPDQQVIDVSLYASENAKGALKIKGLPIEKAGRHELRVFGLESTKHKLSLKLDLTHPKGKSVIELPE